MAPLQGTGIRNLSKWRKYWEWSSLRWYCRNIKGKEQESDVLSAEYGPKSWPRSDFQLVMLKCMLHLGLICKPVRCAGRGSAQRSEKTEMWSASTLLPDHWCRHLLNKLWVFATAQKDQIVILPFRVQQGMGSLKFSTLQKSQPQASKEWTKELRTIGN